MAIKKPQAFRFRMNKIASRLHIAAAARYGERRKDYYTSLFSNR
jgi:hypothetical protein